MVIVPLQDSQNHGPLCKMHATGLSSTVSVVAVVALVTKYHGGQIIVLPTPCIWLVVQWQCGPSRQGSFTPAKGLLQTKGTIDDQNGHAHGLIC